MLRTLRLLVPLALLGQAATLAAQSPHPTYDLVIRNGRIVDGSGNPWFRGDLAVRDGRIVAVGQVPPGEAGQTIDAAGLVVAPGFIDIHSHSDSLLLEDGAAEGKIRQGVTTEILGEGGSAGPNRSPSTKNPQAENAPNPPSSVDAPKGPRWPTLAAYFAALERSGTAVNVASYVGLDNIWRAEMGDSFARPTADQRRGMCRLVDEAMGQGALGLSSQLMMPPGSLATIDDIVELCRIVARHGGIFSSHVRNEGSGVFAAVREAIQIAERAGLPVDVIHLKIADQEHWGRMGELAELIESARRRGADVQANVYPYTRGNNNLSSIIPPWAHEGGTSAMLTRLNDPAQRKRLKHDIEQGVEGWYNHYTAVGRDWSRMLISGECRYKGLTMDRVLALRAKDKTGDEKTAGDPLDELFDLLIEENGSVSTVYAHHTEADMNLALTKPWCSIGSDGSAFAVAGPLRRGNPHPRNFGTFPRVLGEYVRVRGLLTLEDAVRKMTSLNAAKIGLRDRGLLREGMAADITLFDPATVADRATYEEPFQYPVGIEYVVVNGKIVLERGRRTEVRPGRVLRGPAYEPEPN
jgi:N-acyl-D-aspartate/D-glutamate deacylase